MIIKPQIVGRRTLLAARNARNFWTKILRGKNKPLASEVLTSYLLQSGEPPWTSYFVRYVDVANDQRGMSHFNWPAGDSNYHVLRTGCFPYIKYHCSKRPAQDLSGEDRFFKAIKILNLAMLLRPLCPTRPLPAQPCLLGPPGIPTLMYGLAATQLIRHREIVRTPRGDVTIYFLLPEDKGSQY
ncbi:PREDICTED: uncharacterized protein C15orf61 homolog isoform X1 [Dinoponera quadriceps]|uniref:Uncharacterized protein C15orf61 homolog isoform X1 n=1 Tax=Dinoponera quadriceps TaxID=609295 RepID=A0A6P3WU94_DINQU|nr:PREDICTED: uncharacterized protein C15orf61 homolog isoform X1 [Dinoponera quadriceps]XP_014469244.1 PREDICTED: uncharacterized protein C15orf61 homolog isoform X1 [Dinoponera quadriceps]XP_014469245.1 PREDICTED: uncharacterized protein C15orf61 homolog isoform X1 [Dinoponera quadriceps]XP_014469246.1 PREDICTED: uncharacterized protein C15orf61 homolog isoform X1 [Dinoponera quadriceps]XP_014469247.1 PREDICTED: uncharacterized protein C15orf61 homolog isoform X1 [Dinoponera quadriceps]